MFLLILASAVFDANAEFSLVPLINEAVVGETAYFDCTTTTHTNEVQWYHYRVGAKDNEDICLYCMGKTHPQYENRIEVQRNASTDSYRLTINSVQLEDAGSYICHDNGGIGDSLLAQLVVLASAPMCHTNMKPDGLLGPNSCNIDPERLQISCNVVYHGNISPVLQWREFRSLNSTKEGLYCSHTGFKVTCDVALNASLDLHGSSYVCETTSSSTKRYNCSTGVVRIIHANTNNSASKLAYGTKETVVCLANSSQSCSYTWKWVDEGGGEVVSTSAALIPSKTGLYKCEAECSIRGKQCTVLSRQILVSEVTDCSSADQLCKPYTCRAYIVGYAVIGGLVILLLVAIAVGIVFVVLYLRIKRTKKCWPTENRPEFQNSKQQLGLLEPDQRKEHENIELIDNQEETEHLLPRPTTNDLTKKIKELETQLESESTEAKALRDQLKKLSDEAQRTSKDNKARKTSATLTHTIVTKASEKVNGPNQITGMAILDSNLFVVKKDTPDVEVYDSETFVYLHLLDKLCFTNPLDIASSKENRLLYVIDRYCESESIIWKFNTSGVGPNSWATENDNGRLSTYESNLIICFSTKRIIIEYTPEGHTVNVVPLSPGNGFNNLWHAVKLTVTHFVVSHSTVDGGQRVCVVDIKGSVLKAFEKLPDLSKNFLSRDHIPICLVGQRDESVLVADARNKRVLLLSPKELVYENVLIETDETQTPLRLCLNEANDRLFVGVAVDTRRFSTSETPKEGRILIYNLTK